MNTSKSLNESLPTSTTEISPCVDGSDPMYLTIIGCLAGLSIVLIVVIVALLLYFKWYKQRRPNRQQDSSVNKEITHLSRPRKLDPKVYENKYEVPYSRGRNKNKGRSEEENNSDAYVNHVLENCDSAYEPVDIRNDHK